MEIHAQLHNLRKTTMGDVLVTLSIDKAFAGSAADLMFHDVGTQFKVTLEEEGIVEDPNIDTTRKFQIRMHALIREVAEQDGETEEDVKQRLRIALADQGLIKKSTSELDIKGYTIANKLLHSWKR